MSQIEATPEHALDVMLAVGRAFLASPNGEMQVPATLDRHQGAALYGVLAYLEAAGAVETFEVIDHMTGKPIHRGKRLSMTTS
ncbi:MAG TPA: hypothetical protein VFH59_15795 [Frateuria sp.]|uniref:hypothetical protein n=1 Tax=Frateuria sp. TaxID=2211372 RepID=UPI002D7E3795|nr:hypothetical protein [Frateuria sp.]HET6806897.1 hypothetical protein [Frateuria sp.]